MEDNKIVLKFYWEEWDCDPPSTAVVCYDEQLENRLGEKVFGNLAGGYTCPDAIKANAARLGFDAEVIEA